MPTPLRADFDATRLRATARENMDAGQTRRLLALATIYEGASRTEAARIGGVILQLVRDRVIKLNEQGPGGLIDPARSLRCMAWCARAHLFRSDAAHGSDVMAPSVLISSRPPF